MQRRSVRAVALAVMLGAFSISFGQEVRANISGIVTDPSGAPIVGAAVTATSISTNQSVTAKTNETGSYATPFLAPGAYQLTVESQGFKKYVHTDITLQAADKARLDIQLEVGALNQSVTVSAAVSQLQTETASRSQVLANEIVANLPTQGRNPFQIAWAASGVVKSGSWRYLRSFDIGGTSGISINGGREKTNEVLLDGISNVRAEYTVISIPTTESVQEFKVQTNTYDAQYGRTGGGVITMVTKGGGNDFHGTMFEYFQNDKLNANQSELNAPQTVAGVFYPNGRKPPNHINQFGAQFSGPIWIPKVFNGKNRVFWMLSWESMRQRSADPDVKTFPEMAWRTGDFSTLLNAQGQQVQIYDPFSTLPDGSRTPIPGNRIPSAQLDPIAVKAMGYYPAPSSPGTGPAHINNYPYPSIWRAGFDQFVGRTDVIVNSHNSVFFRYNQNPFSEYRAVVFGLDNPAEPTGNAPLNRNGRNIMMNWTSTLTPTFTFDFRFGLNRWEEAGGSSLGAGYDPKQLGFDPNLVAQFKAYQFPNFQLEGYQNIGSNAISPGTRDTYSMQPNFNKVMGRHFMKFGAEGRQYNQNNAGGGYPSGQYFYNKNWTQANANRADAVSGNGLATFLLGIPSRAYVQKTIDPSYRHFYFASFFQDDWKVSNNLTLNFGIRWDTETGNLERYNRMINGIDLAGASPIASASGVALKGVPLFAGINGQPRTLFDSPKNNWQPRIGAAYRLFDKYVIRGGYGLYFIGDDRLGASSGFSRDTEAIVSTDGLKPVANMRTANPFVALPGGKLLDPIGTSLGANSFLGEGVTAWVRGRGLPYTHQYSFDIQRELAGGFLFEIGYGGNTTKHLPVDFSGGTQINFVPTSELGRRTASGIIDQAYYTALVPNPMAGLIPNNASLNGATIQRRFLMYAFPQFSSVALNSLPIGKNQYHGMTVKVTKRLSGGLSFLSSYSVGKNLQQVRPLNAQDFNGVGGDWDAIRLVKESNQNIDTPQKFAFAGIYELPFGRGRKYAASAPGVVNQIVGGWQLNYDVTYQKGWVVDYPNAAQVRPGSAKLDNPSFYQVFDTSLWKTSTGTPVATQEPYTLRTFPYLFSDVRRPGFKNWNASLSKIFPIKEQLRLQFRFEMVNLMNHPWYADMASTDVTNAAFGQLNPAQRNLPRFIKLGMHLTF